MDQVKKLPEFLVTALQITNCESSHLFGEIILNPVAGQGGVCGFWGVGQGATTRNGIPLFSVRIPQKNRAILDLSFCYFFAFTSSGNHFA